MAVVLINGRLVAEDGGPASIRQVKSVKLLDTLIVHKGDPKKRFRISRASFDPSIHQVISEDNAPKRAMTEADRGPTVTEMAENAGPDKREELLKMTVAALKDLPEWEKTDKTAKTKEEIADAILAVRG